MTAAVVAATGRRVIAAGPPAPGTDLLVALGGPPSAGPARRVGAARRGAPRGTLPRSLEDLVAAPPARPTFVVDEATREERRAYAALRRRAFVDDQGLFAGDDTDAFDGLDDTVVLVARDDRGTVLGGVRLHPMGDDSSLGWWQGSRLVCGAVTRRGDVAAALVRAACATAETRGALRFDATVQRRYERFFARLGWDRIRDVAVAGLPHVLMRHPVGPFAALVAATKAPLADLLRGMAPGGAGWVGDDGVPLAGTDVIAACDAILPGMVARDPEWAGWCGMLVTANDLSAMGAAPVGVLDTIAAPDRAHAAQIIAGLRAGSAAFGLPVLGGHTALGVPAGLSVTGFGRTARPVPGGGGRAGDAVTLTADLGGGWRPGYRGSQWDSTSGRRTAERRTMLDAVATARPRAAKDVSMAGVVGTLGMLAEAGGCGAELRVADVPRPAGANAADWMSCFPGFAMLTADRSGAPALPAGPATGAACGRLISSPGVTLVWPDGERTVAVPGSVTGMGPAGPSPTTKGPA